MCECCHARGSRFSERGNVEVPSGMKGEWFFWCIAYKKKNSCGQNTIFLCGNPKTKRHNSSKKIPFFLIDRVRVASSYIGVVNV
jgi:hypothetical protein